MESWFMVIKQAKRSVVPHLHFWFEGNLWLFVVKRHVCWKRDWNCCWYKSHCLSWAWIGDRVGASLDGAHGLLPPGDCSLWVGFVDYEAPGLLPGVECAESEGTQSFWKEDVMYSLRSRYCAERAYEERVPGEVGRHEQGSEGEGFLQRGDDLRSWWTCEDILHSLYGQSFIRRLFATTLWRRRSIPLWWEEEAWPTWRGELLGAVFTIECWTEVSVPTCSPTPLARNASHSTLA